MDLFDGPEGKAVCGRLNHAFAAIYFPVDAAGKPVAGPVEVRGFMMGGASQCRDSAKSAQLDYRLVP